MITRRELRARLDGSALFASLLSLSFVALAVAVRWLLDPWLGDNLALVTLYGAVAAAVWIGGYTQGVATAIVGYLACDYLFVAPRGTFGFVCRGTDLHGHMRGDRRAGKCHARSPAQGTWA